MDPNLNVYDRVIALNDKELSTMDRKRSMVGVENVPDGIVNIEHLNSSLFQSKLQVNDYK